MTRPLVTSLQSPWEKPASIRMANRVAGKERKVMEATVPGPCPAPHGSGPARWRAGYCLGKAERGVTVFALKHSSVDGWYCYVGVFQCHTATQESWVRAFGVPPPHTARSFFFPHQQAALFLSFFFSCWCYREEPVHSEKEQCRQIHQLHPRQLGGAEPASC